MSVIGIALIRRPIADMKRIKIMAMGIHSCSGRMGLSSEGWRNKLYISFG